MIEITKEKEMNSSTRVEGILVQTNASKQWYGITIFQAARNPWMGRIGICSTTGKMDLSIGSEFFQKRYASKPTFEEVKVELLAVLNGAETTIENISY